MMRCKKCGAFLMPIKLGIRGHLTHSQQVCCLCASAKRRNFPSFLLDSDKRYRVIARLGQRTDTSDSHGEIISERNVEFTQQQLDDALAFFRGDTLQVPSMYSALKHQGRPLYEYARKGIMVEREARPITVYELQFIRLENNELELEIHCSKGTYIRTIIDDLGEMLGCGAHVIYLRRVQVANYPYERMVTLEQLAALRAKVDAGEGSFESLLDTLLLPMDTAVVHFPAVNITEETAAYFKQGQPVRAAVEGLEENGMVRVTCGTEQRFIGIALVSEDGRIAPKRLVVENEQPA